MKLNKEDLTLFDELVAEFYDLHPQLHDVEEDDNGKLYEYKDGYISYDSYGPSKVKAINQLSGKLKSLT